MHEQLTALVVRGGDLKGLAAMVSEALSGRVAILDEGLRVICTAEASEDREEAASAPSAELEPFDVSEPIRLALRESRKSGYSVAASKDESIKCRSA